MQAGLRTRGFQLEFRWVWAGVGYVIGISMLYMALQIAALTFLGRRCSAATQSCTTKLQRVLWMPNTRVSLRVPLRKPATRS